ncbi:MAG TPA: sigma-E factor negative regulatory protein [Spongiibacteraceae bacterium]|jgi:sigma-E factor negative regulatory protein RseA
MSDVSGSRHDKLGESISALVDGEADELELRRLLASADTQSVRNTWRDYHLQRDMLAGVDMQFAHLDISQRVQAALAAEALPSVAVAGSRWWRPLASVAVAASVATAVVIGARSFSPGTDNGNAAVAQTQPVLNVNRAYPQFSPALSPVAGNVAVSAQYNDLIPNAGVQPVALDPDQLAQQRLQQYLLRHTERAALNNSQGVINFAKVSQLNNAQ